MKYFLLFSRIDKMKKSQSILNISNNLTHTELLVFKFDIFSWLKSKIPFQAVGHEKWYRKMQKNTIQKTENKQDALNWLVVWFYTSRSTKHFSTYSKQHTLSVNMKPLILLFWFFYQFSQWKQIMKKWNKFEKKKNNKYL